MYTLSDDDITSVAKSEGVDPRYLLAIRDKENSGDTDVSSAGAKGRFQLLPATFKSVHPEGDIDDPKDNAIAAARYLKVGLEKGEGDFSKAAAFYYAGPAWERKIKRMPEKKYGGNLDDTGGISIEEYARQAVGKVRPIQNYATGAPPDSVIDSGGVDTLDSILVKLARDADSQLGRVNEASISYSDKIRKNIESQMEATRKGGELAATVELDKFQQQQTRAGENAAILSKLGINTSDLDSEVAKISTALVEDFRQAQDMRRGIEEKRSIGIFDDPLQYVVNQFSLPQEIRQHNAVVRRMASQKEFVDQATQIATHTQAVNATKFTPISYQGAQASAELLRNAAEEKALSLEDKLLKTDFDTQVRTLTSIQSRMQSINYALEAEQRQGARADVEKARNLKIQTDALDDSQIRLAGRVMGIEVPNRKSLDKMPKDVKSAVEYVMANGGGIGKDPLEAWAVLQRGNPVNMPPAVKYQKDKLDVIKRQAQETLGKSELAKTMNAKQIQEAVSREMTTVINHMAQDPNFSVTPVYNGVPDNPYHIPTPTVMAALPESRSLPIAKIIKTHVANFPKLPITDNQVMELAYENIGEGKAYRDLTDAAKDVATYYETGIKYNNDKMRFSGFGMPDQTNYFVKNTDMSRYDSVVKHYLEKKRSEFEVPDFGKMSAPGEPITTVAEKIEKQKHPSKPFDVLRSKETIEERNRKIDEERVRRGAEAP